MGMIKQNFGLVTPTRYIPNMLDYLSIECFGCRFDDMTQQQGESMMEAIIRDAANNWDA